MQKAPLNLRQLTIILGILAAFGPLSIDMYLPGLPAIASDFAVTTDAVQFTVAIFLIGLAGGQIIYGPLADRLGRKKPLIFGAAVYTIASLGCALAPSLGVLVALRLAQAVGACAAMVIVRSIVRDCFETRDAAKVFSTLMLIMGLAPITAPLLGGQLLIFLGWRSIFWFLTLFGLICLLLIIFKLPETLPAERRINAGLGSALRTYLWLFRDRQFIGYALAGGCVSAGMFTYIAASPYVIIEYYRVPAEWFGGIFGAIALGLILASQVNRALLNRYDGNTILLGVMSVIAISSVWLVLMAATGWGGLVGLLIPLFICIAGYGLIVPNTGAAALANHGANAGSASALMGSLQFTIGATASALVGILHNQSPLPMALVIALCEIAGLALLIGLALRPLRPAPTLQP